MLGGSLLAVLGLCAFSAGVDSYTAGIERQILARLRDRHPQAKIVVAVRLPAGWEVLWDSSTEELCRALLVTQWAAQWETTAGELALAVNNGVWHVERT